MSLAKSLTSNLENKKKHNGIDPLSDRERMIMVILLEYFRIDNSLEWSRIVNSLK